MLKGDLYRIIGESRSEERLQQGLREQLWFRIGLNAGHDIFKGHFPGNPVVPGVCQVEMIRELLGTGYKKDFILSVADNIKFLTMIVPSLYPQIEVKLEVKEKESEMKEVNGVIFYDEVIFLKFRGIFKPQ